MTRRLGRAVAACAVAAALAPALAVAQGFYAATTANPGNAFGAAPDWTAPRLEASTLLRTGACGSSAGFLRQGRNYQVFASVTDSGNPASGTSSVTSSTTSLTTGATATNLVAGSYTVSGTAYNFRSATITADATISAGSKSWSVTTRDTASNSRTQSGTAVTVDNTAPSGNNVRTANGTGTAGRPDAGDTLTYSYSEPVDALSIVSGSCSAAVNVVVRIDNNTSSGSRDTFTVWNSAGTTQLPVGTVNLQGSGYVTSNVAFGATGTPSTLSVSGSSVVITLGTPSGSTWVDSAGLAPTWVPSSSALDRAGNNAATTSVTSSVSGPQF